MSGLRHLLLLLSLCLLASCSLFVPKFEKPTVTVTAFRMDYPQSIHPQFMIDLHVVNPNSKALQLNGLSYSASIEGHQLLTGASNQLPVIAAYGEGNISLTATPDLLGGIRLVQDLMQRQRGDLQYSLAIKLDIKGWPFPLTVEESGTIGVATRRF